MKKNTDNITLENYDKQNLVECIADLNNVRSLYIMKNIFSFLSKKKTLKIISFNNKYQNKLGICLDDYKKLCEIYIDENRNGFGKILELKTKTTIFEGNFLNGKKNGKGKEYNKNHDIIFEGIYLNDIKMSGNGYDENGNNILKIEEDGKGKEYYDNGNIQFEGEYLNGKKWNGKGYNYKGEKFEGEYFCGKRNGNGKEYNLTNQIEFEGEYLNGERWNGIFKEYNLAGELDYEVKYIDGKRDGECKEYYDTGELEFEGSI